MNRRSIGWVSTILAASCAGALGCTGVVGSPSGSGPSSGLGSPNGAGPGAAGSAGQPGATDPNTSRNGPQPVARLHKLTASEFANSVRDLLGSAVSLSAVEPDTEIDGFATIGGSTVSVSQAGVGRQVRAVGTGELPGRDVLSAA